MRPRQPFAWPVIRPAIRPVLEVFRNGAVTGCPSGAGSDTLPVVYPTGPAPDYGSGAPPTHSPLRVGIDGRVLSDAYHGIGRVTEALVRELVQVPGVTVVLALGTQSSTRFNVGALLSLPYVESIEFRLPMTSPRQIMAWPSVIKAARVDAMVFPYHLGAPLSGLGPRLVMMHDCILESRPEFAPSARVRVAYRLLSTLITRTNGILTPSATSARAVRRFYHLPRAKIQVVPNGVDQKFFGRPVLSTLR